jgi:hypothetical protein
MDTHSQKCMDIDTVDSFCDCIAGDETADPSAQAFCNLAKTDKNISGESLTEQKMALMDMEEDACCAC